MPTKSPKTPFSTRLSGSAKETELRLRSIFQWQKKRPPVWMFAVVVLVMFGCIGLVSCQQEQPENPAEGQEQSEIPVEKNVFGDKYRDFFANYQSDLGSYQYTGDTRFAFDDRKLTLQDVPENQVEELLVSNYCFEAAFEFQGLLGLQGSENLQSSVKNEAKNAEKGWYFENVTIHTLDTLSEGDFTPDGSYFAGEAQAQSFIEELRELVQEYGLAQYSVVYADLSWLWSESALALGPQLGNGRYERLYLVGKISEDANWHLYECFWGEYTLERAYPWEQFALQLLQDSLRYEDEVLSFTIPTPMQAGTGVQGTWDIQIAGRAETEDLGGMSLHYLEGETWQTGKTYTINIPAQQWAQIVELRMEARVEEESRTIDLLRAFRNENASVAELLVQQGLTSYEYYSSPPTVTTLLQKTVGSRSLVLAKSEGFPHLAGLCNLVMGVWDEAQQEFVGETYALGGDQGTYTSWNGMDGCLYLLWSNTTYYNGIGTSHGVDFFCFDGQNLEPLSELPACALRCGFLPNDQADGVLGEAHDFWYDRMAHPIDKGLYLYQRNPAWDSTRPAEGEQWVYIGYVPFEVTDSGLTQVGVTLLTDYFRGNGWNYDRVYFLGQEPGAPREGDVRIDAVRYLGSERTYETTGEAYAVTRSYYMTRQTGTEISTGWEQSGEIYVIMGRSMDGELDEVRGYTNPNTAKSINQQILEVTYGLMDLEVSLWRDGYPNPAGPTGEIFFFREVNDGPEEIEVWDDPGHVLYGEGDYWAWHRWEGFTALCYHNAAEGRYHTNRIETTRTDLFTYRGIRVGDTRAKVLEAYPELYDTEYWGYEGDYLWYCVNEMGLGAGLIFYFENDAVSKIELNNMFN